MYQQFETHKWFSDMGDLIGIESSVDLCTAATSSVDKGVPRSREKEFPLSLPPPLPPRGVMKRHRTCDGRLVIESGSLPDILRARRENNRLTIDLVSLCNDDHDIAMDGCDEASSDQAVEEEEEKEEPLMMPTHDHGSGIDGGDGASDERTVEEEEEEPVRIYKYGYGVRSNPCMVGMAVPAIRHVRI